MIEPIGKNGPNSWGQLERSSRALAEWRLFDLEQRKFKKLCSIWRVVLIFLNQEETLIVLFLSVFQLGQIIRSKLAYLQGIQVVPANVLESRIKNETSWFCVGLQSGTCTESHTFRYAERLPSPADGLFSILEFDWPGGTAKPQRYPVVGIGGKSLKMGICLTNPTPRCGVLLYGTYRSSSMG